MSDELEARMWDEGGSRYECRGRSAYYESAFASSEHLDRAPLLSEVRFSDNKQCELSHIFAQRIVCSNNIRFYCCTTNGITAIFFIQIHTIVC